MAEVFEIASGRARLAAEASGDGVPVVMLHAGVCDRRMWREQLRALARMRKGFRALAYDRRGHGETLHVDEPYSEVGDLVAVLDKVAPRARAILVGCSMGGRIAIDTALAHPRRVRGLMLVAPAVGGAPEPRAYPAAIQAWIDRMERAEAANDTDRINALEAHAWLDGPLARDGRVGGPVRDLFLAMNELALRAEPRGTELHAPAAWDRLDAIRAPTLVAWGNLDFPDVIAAAEHVVARVGGARRYVFTGAAHLPSLEQPAAFNRLLADFCSDCVSAD
jgi:pimeloyl-ACP methyl ester carboxylesterase